MPTLWDFFHKSDEKQNSAHYKSYCKGCLDKDWLEFQYPVAILIQLKKSKPK